MFLVTFSEETRDEWENKTREFTDEALAKAFVSECTPRSDFKHLRLWAPVGEESIDYKAKFEELYDNLLKQAGVRPTEKLEKPSTSATVKD